MNIARRMRTGPVHAGWAMLARRASRRVHSSHAETTGIRNP
jgi:hypothetical protein